MGLVPAVLVGGVQVVGLVDVGVGTLGKLVQERGCISLGLDHIGVLGIVTRHRTVHVAVVLERVGVVALDGETLERLQGEVHGLAQVVYLVLVEVVLGEEHEETVHDRISVVLGVVQGGTVRIRGGIARKAVAGALREIVVDATLARIEVGAVEVARVGADPQPVGHVEGDLRAQVHA